MRGHRLLGALLSCAVTFVSMQTPAQAAMVSTLTLMEPVQRSNPANDPSQLAARLEALGASPRFARQRAATLTDEERAELAAKFDQLPAGGDVLGALAFIGLVLLLSDVLGYTDVYPFVKHTVNGDKPTAKKDDCEPTVPAVAKPPNGAQRNGRNSSPATGA